MIIHDQIVSISFTTNINEVTVALLETSISLMEFRLELLKITFVKSCLQPVEQ